MYELTRRVLIINFNGIGNGIWILPMLKCLEEVAPNCKYFHIHNPVFDSKEFMDWMGLKNRLGTAPTSWRRFEPSDWKQIKLFFERHSIDLVINLRNEGPLRDVGYDRFRTEMGHSGVEFWQLDQMIIASRHPQRHLLADQLELLGSHGIDLLSFNRLWLRDYFSGQRARLTRQKTVGFFTGASQDVKTWPAEQWVALGQMLLDRSECDLTIYSGKLDSELVLAQTVFEQILTRFPSRCSMVKEQTLESLCAHLACLDLIVSNDTSCVHIAAALNVPTIGLYFSTNAAIWGGMNESFISVQSQTGLECPSFKRDAGNCNFYYGGCPGPCKDEVTPERVFRAMENHLLMPACPSVFASAERTVATGVD
jgi:ADP-heptose:LPS heptosyltransferase